MTVFPRVKELMNDKEIGDILLTGGGIIPKEDMDKLQNIGVGKLFGPGTPIQETVNYITNWVSKYRR